MVCVNVKDKNFVAISKRLDIVPKILEGVIDGYWVANPEQAQKQEFPSDQYILESLKLGGVSSTQFSSLQEYENAHALWEKDYSNVRTFNNPFDARAYHYLASQLFGGNNVGIHPRLDKTFDVSVLEPKNTVTSFKKEEQGEDLMTNLVSGLNSQIDTLSTSEKKQIANREEFYTSKVITPLERNYLAKQTIAMFSMIVDNLQGIGDITSSEASKLYFGEKYADKDFSSMDRSTIIHTIGPMNIFHDIIKEKFFNPYVREDVSDEVFDKLEVAYINFDSLLQCGYHKLITNEHIPLVGNYQGKVNDQDQSDDDLDNNEGDKETQGNQSEKYQIRTRSISVKDSLSPMIRRALDRIKERDENGNIIIDKFGLHKLIDTDTVYNTILASIRKATTIDQMESILQESLNISPWMSEILDLIKQEPFRSQFYQNFRKDFSKYSIVNRELDDDGNYTYTTKIINTNDLTKSIISDVSNLLHSGELTLVYHIDPTTGYGVVDDAIVNAAKARLDVLMKYFANTNKQHSKAELLEFANKNYKEVSGLLQVVGINLNDLVIRNILAGTKSKSKLFGSKDSIGYNTLSYVDSILSTIQNSKNKERYSLLGKDDDSVKGYYTDLAKATMNYMEQSVESSTYENGKMYYSYVTPSYLGKLVLNLKNSMGDKAAFDNFMEKNYTQFDWFVHNNEHSNEWLRLLSQNTEKGAEMRDMFDHKVQLHYNNIGYQDLSALDYTLSLMQEFFSDFSKSPKFAWYHVPILADKPSAEFIKFRRYTDSNSTTIVGYEQEIVSQLVKVAKQELRRMKTVKERASLDVEKIKNFDTNGSKFNFLEFLNDAFVYGKGTEAELVQEYLNGKVDNASKLTTALEAAIKVGLESKFQSALKTWEKIGVLDIAKNPKTDKDTLVYLNDIASDRAGAEKALKNYFYNSYFATTEIIQLTVTDIAYYENPEDFQKRFAQIHSPALRLNVTATDSEGNRYTKDGIERTMYIADEIVTSDVIGVVEKMFEDKIKTAKNASQKKGYTKLKEDVLKGFKKINVTDAQAYTTLKGYRKKMGQAGKWTPAMEEALGRINAGNMNLSDLDIICQPMKPFVYTQIAKQSYSKVMKLLKVPIQNKNSEYILIMAGAIAASQGGKVNKLRAITEFMDKHDIDTIQFGTAVKSGQQGIININDAVSEAEVKAILEAHTYELDPVTNEKIKEAGLDKYNTQYVHEIPFEDYGIQQEVPEHLMDAFQLFGSQIRKLIMADITPGTIFKVEGQNLSKDALIEEYQQLIAANVETSFNTLVKELKLDSADLKVKNKAISDLLVEEIENNSRYGPELLRACSLNTDGDFVIPLADPTQSYRIQQLMNSIIKSRITKQKIKGGAVVQVSPYGLSDDLNIVFNEDGSIKYFECYMPAYAEDFLEVLREENGQLNINKKDANGNPLFPEELRNLIGYRIPTEDKYSMTPLYIKGFLAQESGSAIMLPKEITLLSGSDYDIDKLYVMLPEFDTIRRFNKPAFIKDFKKSLGEKSDKDQVDIAYSLVVTREGMDGISEGSLEDKMNKFYQENSSKYNTTQFVKFKYDVNQSPISQSTEARNNRIIDLMYSVLTNKDTSEKIFNPGSFDTQKKSARIINILKSTKQYIYNDLKDLSIKELDNIIDTNGFKFNKSIVDPTTQVAFHQQNTTAGKLIGIFANHNSSHAIMQLQQAHFRLKDTIIFDGIDLSSIYSPEDPTMGGKIDNIYALDGFTYIGKNNAGFLAASVDAVKDPVLNFMNLNTYTANVAMVLSRLGFDPDSIGLLLTQPIIEKVTQEYFRKSNENYITSDSVVTEAINELLKELGGGLTEKAIVENLATSPFTKQMLGDNLNIEDSTESKQFQLETLVLFKKLLKMGSDLNELTFITKYDTVSNAVGPTIADSLAKQLRVSKFMSRPLKPGAPFSESTYQVLENSPLLNAFYRYSEMSSYLMFADNFPHFQQDFEAALIELRDTTKADINVKTVNKFMNDFISFKLTKGLSSQTFAGDKVARQKYIQDFPMEFQKTLADPKYSDNALIRILEVKPKSKKNPMPTLVANVGGLSADAIEIVKNAWAELYSNEETKEIALELFRYNFYRSGFSFSPTSFMHLVPIEVKLGLPNYVDSLRSTTNDGNIFDLDNNQVKSFISQFRRNYSWDRKIVPNLDNSKLKIVQLNSGEIEIDQDEENSELQKIIVSDDDKVVYANMITVTEVDKNKNIVENLYLNTSSEDSKPYYRKITPLGYRNNAQEYSFNSEDVSESVIPENLKARITSSNPDNISGMDEQTMQKVYKENTGIIDEITSFVNSFSTEKGKELIGNTKDRKSKVIKLLREYSSYSTMDAKLRTKLIDYFMNTKLKDESGQIIC